MPQALAATPNSANLGSGNSCTGRREMCTIGAVNFAINEVLKSKFPLKTWAHLAALLGLQERAAKYRLSNSRAYTVDELQTLLHSEDGLDFLMAVMGEAQPAWWRWINKVMTLAAVRRRQAEDAQEILKLETSGDADVGARRRIKGALNAEKRISSAVARAETSLGLSRPNLDRVGFAAGGGSSRVPSRAVAGASKR